MLSGPYAPILFFSHALLGVQVAQIENVADCQQSTCDTISRREKSIPSACHRLWQS